MRCGTGAWERVRSTAGSPRWLLRIRRRRFRGGASGSTTSPSPKAGHRASCYSPAAPTRCRTPTDAIWSIVCAKPSICPARRSDWCCARRKILTRDARSDDLASLALTQAYAMIRAPAAAPSGGRLEIEKPALRIGVELAAFLHAGQAHLDDRLRDIVRRFERGGVFTGHGLRAHAGAHRPRREHINPHVGGCGFRRVGARQRLER